MADTSELLKMCNDTIMSEAMNELKGVCPGNDKRLALKLARALKSRLHAEAPTISDAHVHCPACGQHVHFKFDAPITQRAQAEAQAPTTAASVLTEDEQILVDDFKEAQRKYPNSSLASKWHNGLLAIIDRLTVGAPAPAPTHARQCGYWLDLNCSCGIEGDTP